MLERKSIEHCGSIDEADSLHLDGIIMRDPISCCNNIITYQVICISENLNAKVSVMGV